MWFPGLDQQHTNQTKPFVQLLMKHSKTVFITNIKSDKELYYYFFYSTTV